MFKLRQIAKKAEQDKQIKFSALIHHMNEQNLAECYYELKRNKACGIDGVTVEAYGEKLGENLKELVIKLKTKEYRPQPVRRVYIPKPGKNEKRGLGIPSVEDKIVQMMLKKLLENIFEADFLDCSYGFRPGRNCHDAVNALDKAVMTKSVNYIVEVDIKGFFDNVQHDWLEKCLQERVTDPNLLWLIRRFLKAGIMEAGQYEPSTLGTPQGGVCSPLLANVYLHYVLDLWFEKRFKRQARGYVELIRYCDDYVVCCGSEKDAQEFLEEMKERLAKFGLEVAEAKTRLVKFGRKAWLESKRSGKKAESFDFLGFTHFHKASRRGHFIMGHKTIKGRLSRSLKDINSWLKEIRSQLPLKDWWPTLKAKLTGHYNYFGISGNFRCIKQYYWAVKRLVFKWINRRSQKKSMDCEVYQEYLGFNPLPEPRICRKLYTL